MSQSSSSPSSVFKVGAIALAFLIVGYQVALFVHKASAERLVANRDHPDTIYIIDRKLAEEVLGDSKDWQGVPSGTIATLGARGGTMSEANGGVERSETVKEGSTLPIKAEKIAIRKHSSHSPEARATAEKWSPRTVESFRFDPNTVSLEDLMRLGFSEKQAQSIDNYRAKGGRFRRKADFAKSYVVADSVFERLEPFIDIPKIDINRADSAAFDSLPGIGGWFASRMVEYRQQLHGYSCPEQLMEIYRFDQERFDGLKELISCSSVEPYPLWSLPADSLRLHPHIRSWQTARAIVFFREHNLPDAWSVDALLSAGILTPDQASKLHRCRLK